MVSETAVITRDREGAVIGWSAGAQRLTGYAGSEILGRALASILQLDGDSMRAPSWLTTKDGTRRRVLRTSSPLYDGDEIVGFSEVLREHDGADAAPLASSPAPTSGSDPERIMRVLLECTPYGCVVVDELGRIRVVNEAARAMFGYEESELAAAPVHLLVPSAQRDEHSRYVKHFMALPPTRGRMAPGQDLAALRKDGSSFPAQIDLGSFEVDSGRYVVATVLDLTAQKQLEQLADESERRFLQLAECLPQLVFTCQPDGRVDYLCRRWSDYVGAPLSELLEEGYLAYLHPDDREHARQAIQHAVATGIEYRSVARIRRHDGVYRWFDTRADPLRDAQGRVTRWFGSNTDVHEAHEAREALERERQHLQRIIATAPGVFVSYRQEADGRLTCPLASPDVEQIYGYDVESLRVDAAPIWATLHPDDLPRVTAETEECARTLTAFRGEYRVQNPRRGEIWVESHSHPAVAPDGTLEWYGFVRDITERKRDEESLRNAQAQLVAALEAGGMGLWVWDLESDSLHVDDSLLKLFGRGREALTGTVRDAKAFVHPDDLLTVASALEALAKDGAPRDFDYRVVAADDGGTRWLAARGHGERDARGRIVRVTALHMDVTLRRRVAEAQLRAQKLEALGTLAGGIAHDFNNILQAIVGNTALVLSMLPPDHRARGFLDATEVASSRASDLVRRMLAFSRPEEPAPTVVRIADEVAEALKLVRSTLPGKVEIRAELGGTAPNVAADPTQIHQLVVNLVTNAAHAMGEHGGIIRVQIGTAGGEGRPLAPVGLPEGPYALLQVADDGSGMPSATLARIFDPFFTTKPVGEGTGLGLSVVHGIMKSLGGAVAVQSEPGRGTVFDLYFPAAAPQPDEPAHGAVGTFTGAGEHILFVDDEPMLVTLSTRILEMLGYKATGHTDPLEAIKRFIAEPTRFDAVLTDVAMPGISGFQLAERLLAVRSDVPIIMMSGYVSGEETERALRIGVRELLLKPVSIDELNRALSRALAGARLSR